MAEPCSQHLRIAPALQKALLRVGQGDGAKIHRRHASRLAQLGLVQADMFNGRLTLTADGRAQLGTAE